MAKETVELQVAGMTCGNCVAHVEKALASVRGTKNIVVDLEAGKATMQAKADRAMLVAAVSDAGYQAS